MNANLHPIFAQDLAPFAPPDSEVHRIAADLAYNETKRTASERNERAALVAQVQSNPQHWGIE